MTIRHIFIPNDESKRDICSVPNCNRNKFEHKCQVCERGITVYMLADIPLCYACYEREMELKRQVESNSQVRLDAIRTITLSDSVVQTRADYYNAEMLSIVEMKQLIDNDDTIGIDQKQFKLAEMVQTRVKNLQQSLFEIDEQRIAIINQQRAIQTYLNELSTKLRAEEREKLKLQDLNYQPKAPVLKQPKAPSVKKTTNNQIDAQAKIVANEFGLSETSVAMFLKMFMTSKGLTLEQAVNMFRTNTLELQSKKDN